MASVKKGILTKSPEWCKHLKWAKRQFWHAERKAAKRDIEEQKRVFLEDPPEREMSDAQRNHDPE